MSAPEQLSQATIALAATSGSPDGFVALSRDLRVLRWNPAAERILGWSEVDVLGQRDPSIPEELREEQEAIARAWFDAPGPTRLHVAERVRADGRRVRVALRGLAPLELEGETRGVGVFFSLATDDEVRDAHRTALSRDLVSAITEDEVLDTVDEAVRVLTGATDALVLVRCPSGRHLHGHHAMGALQEEAEQVELALDADLPWQQAVEGRVAGGRLGVGPTDLATLFVPLGPTGAGWVLALRFVDGLPGREVVSSAQSIAAEAWIGLQRATLVTDLAGKIEILEATAAIASSAGLDLDETVAAVARHAAASLSCERAGIYLREDDGEPRLATLYATDLDTTTDAGARTAQEALERQEIVLVQDASTCDFLDGPWHHDEGAVSVMAVPLVVAGRDVGTLVVAHTVANPRGFTNLCQQVGTAVAQQAALAIEHARLYRAEQESVRRLTELDELKRDYVHGITHDLKTPLTGLLGFVNTLKRVGNEATPDDRRRYLDVMERQATRLISMVEDLLVTARREDEVVRPLRQDRVDLIRLVADVTEAYEPARRERIRVTDDGSSCDVSGDAHQLHRVLYNVLDNALKYSSGPVDVVLRSDDETVTLAVHDDGPGVARDERESVFRRFGVGAAGRSAGATGIGLYTSRSIARGHGGELVFLEPEDGSGSSVRLTLPRGDHLTARSGPPPLAGGAPTSE